ncbi:hypothetical protein [Dyadobacter sp. CY312]|uniref:hypothetical protein n=1 Tax=Dyadobacter sp. CY312 TaxID=2907303 RepID=UPI001F1896DF|nr:hypothetical protein [Dyadobacter sp. CY312]MCE7043313.1 hypothetical protein [Dyadobacter sp. CY312]
MKTYFLLILFLATITSCKDDGKVPDERAFLHGKWEVSFKMVSTGFQDLRVEFHEDGKATWNSFFFDGTKPQSHWVYEIDGQKLSLYNPDMNFVILEKSSDQLLAREIDTGIIYTFKKVN